MYFGIANHFFQVSNRRGAIIKFHEEFIGVSKASKMGSEPEDSSSPLANLPQPVLLTLEARSDQRLGYSWSIIRQNLLSS